MKRDEKSNRDKAREQFEEAERKRNQEAKAGSILKFETSFKAMFGRCLKTAVLNLLLKVKEPLFEKDFMAYLESDIGSS